MLNIKQKILDDLKKALLAKDMVSAQTIRFLLAAITNKEKEKRYKISKDNPNATENELQEKSQLSDQEIQEVLMAELKKRKEAIEMFQKGKRQDLVEKETKEIEVLKKYLPEQLSQEEIRKLAKEAITFTQAKNLKEIGNVMRVLMPKIKGKADGATVSKIVQELLRG